MSLSPLLTGWFRIDPTTLKPVTGPVFADYHVRSPTAYAAGAFWISTYYSPQVIRIDLQRASKVRPPPGAPVG